MGDIWPQWRYHRDCPDGRIFARPEDVPPGWVTGPHLIKKEPIVKPTPLPNWADEDEDEVLDDAVEDQMTADAAPQKRPPGRPRRMKG